MAIWVMARHHRPDPRSGARRLADRELQLALGVLHQRAVRHPVLPRHPRRSCRRPQLRKSRFDFFGFAALSLAIGAFQLMLDRGQLKDWFSSTEIWIEAIVAGLAFYLFVVHMLTTTKPPFVSPALFKDRNFLTGNVFIFVVGVVLFATLALLPPLLQDLMNYPVVLTGLVTAPRGIGTLVAMFIVGRLMGRVDTRLIIAAGFALTAFSLWQMTGFYLQMDTRVGRLVGPGAGPRHRLRLRAARGDHLRHAVAAIPQRRHGRVQPDPQHRQQHRHLGGRRRC